MELKLKDFVELEYTGKIKEDGAVFDTTDENLAKENNIYQESMKTPVIVCLGENQILAGLEEELVGKETGKEYNIDLPAEKAFGKKDAKLIQLMPASKFKKQKINPVPGLQLNIDGMMGVIKTASGGRVLVDFNHPLSGQDVSYSIKAKRVLKDTKEKIEEFLKFGLNAKEVKAEVEKDKAKITLKNKLPDEIAENIKTKIKDIIPEVKDIEFISEEKKKINDKE